ncbi:MAG TPA: ATP-dependent sacrificial sulfur transferase LarE [Capsulimonadaceae bacterium]|jgi:uncharacterized protein
MSVYLPVATDELITLPSQPIDEKLRVLRKTLKEMHSVVIGYSGGADSALLTRVAFDELGENAVAVMAISESYPRREQAEARELAAAIGVPLVTVETDELSNEQYASNPVNRCYYCKLELFVHLSKVAKERGIRWLAYGANHDDLGDYRPGQVAASEFGARAPLIEAGLTKPEIRHISRELGLPTWSKPAMACLSSRFPYGTRITAELLAKVEQAEDYLRGELGFRQVRVRHHDTIARIEIAADEMGRLLDPDLRDQVSARIKALGYAFVAVELAGFRSGSLNVGVV